MHRGIHSQVDVHTEGQTSGVRNEIDGSLSTVVDSRVPNLTPFTSLSELTNTSKPLHVCTSAVTF